MIYDSVLDAVGHTPLIRLRRIVEDDAAQVLVKFEAVNVGGSIKTRTALAMIESARHRGLIDDQSIIVEPTSGNQGIGIALVCAVLGLKARIIMPDSVSAERASLIRQYGAEVILIHDEGDIGKAMDASIELALSMAADDPHVFVPQQFSNPDNLRAHINSTALEILEDVAGPIDGFCSGIGTGGTISGVGETLRYFNPEITIWALEPENAAVLLGRPVGPHLQMGIGDGVIPDILDQEVYDAIHVVSDEEAVTCAKRLAREEGLLCGISSGTNVAGALKLARELGPGKTVVTILPDTGERYFSTPLFDE